jgi:hypothetical protein
VPQPTGEAEFRSPRTVQLGKESRLAFEIDPADRRKAPPRLVRELDRGRNWVVLEEPRIFSAAAADLLRGDASFVLEKVEVRFAQQEGERGAVSPVLLVLGGAVRPGTSAVEPAEAAAPVPSSDLDALDNSDLRVALGHGLDAAMALGAAADGLETYSWTGVIEDGAPVTAAVWSERLRAVHREASLDPVRSLKVRVRRYRPQVEPKEAHFLVPLARIVLCAQMEVSRDGDALWWTWEGVFKGGLGPEAPAATPFATPAPAIVRYTQFREVRAEGSAAVWRALLSPVTVGVRYSGEAIERFFD